MSDFSIREMLAMQQALQEKYKDKWEPICPQAGKHKLLWMIGETGEVIDIIKKHGDTKALEAAPITVPASASMTLGMVFVFVLPAAVLIAGAVEVLLRRRR